MASGKVNKAFAVSDWRFGSSFVLHVKVSTDAMHKREVFQKWGQGINFKVQQLAHGKKGTRRWGVTFDRFINGRTKPERFFLSVASFLVGESFASCLDEYDSIKADKKKAGRVLDAVCCCRCL